jgi:hypothetical protein
MSWIGRTAKAAGIGAAALLAASVVAPQAGAATPQKWGTLYAMSDGIKLGAAYGDFANNGGVYATVGANWADMVDNGHPVFVDAQFSFWEKNIKGEWDWVPDPRGDVQSARSSRFKYVGAPLSVRLHSGATQARVEIRVCEDVKHHFDHCSGSAILSFAY